MPMTNEELRALAIASPENSMVTIPLNSAEIDALTPLTERAASMESMTLRSVSAYAKRYSELATALRATPVELAVVTADRAEGKLHFVSNPRHQFDVQVSGAAKTSLEYAILMEEFLCNNQTADGGHTQENLKKIIRRNKRLFSSYSEWAAVLETLESVTAKITVLSKSANDNRGNTEESRQQTLTFVGEYNKAPKAFDLFIPLLSGYSEKIIITIEMITEVVNGSVKWRLENWNLPVMLQEAKDLAIEAEIQALEGMGYLVLEKG